MRWVFEAKKRFGLSVLDYMVTCNHVHFLIKDTGPNVIARSMQLIAGRTGQGYNERNGRHGAFWEDRYHATAIETDEPPLYRMYDDACPNHIQVNVHNTSMQGLVGFNSGGMITVLPKRPVPPVALDISLTGAASN